MIEFYIKSLVSEDYVDPTIVEEFDPIEIYLNQIKMVMSTSQKVMGAAEMNMDLEDEVFNYNVDERTLRDKILRKIYDFCTLSTDFPTTVDVRFFKGTNRDTVLIDINVDARKNLRIFLK